MFLILLRPTSIPHLHSCILHPGSSPRTVGLLDNDAVDTQRTTETHQQSSRLTLRHTPTWPKRSVYRNKHRNYSRLWQSATQSSGRNVDIIIVQLLDLWIGSM